MEFTKLDKMYLDKLRKEYPDRNIPTDTIVESTLSGMQKHGSEELIDDLVIRTWDCIIEFELV